jgi:hypothetical protein
MTFVSGKVRLGTGDGHDGALAPATSGTVLALHAIWGSDASHVWAVGNGGTVLRYRP